MRRWAIDLGWHLRIVRRLYVRWRVRRFLVEERRASRAIVDQAMREVQRRHAIGGRPWY